jgi:hypothetical protein
MHFVFFISIRLSSISITYSAQAGIIRQRIAVFPTKKVKDPLGLFYLLLRSAFNVFFINFPF